MLKKVLFCFGLVSMCLHAIDITKPGLIPSPQEITWGKKASRIQTINVNVRSKKVESFTLKTLQNIFTENKISRGNGYTIILEEAKMDVPRYASEAYTLDVGARSATLRAQTNRGFFYGIQTIRQLIVNNNGRSTIAQCKIVDYPAFQIRGFMHDVGRNFISLDLLKKQIELMSKYKYNVFQWHISDNHGWRLESKAVPELQGENAFLRFHGKYYTQKEFVDFVKFCAERQILVIPELDSPGHTNAFRKALGLKTMNDQRANDTIVKLMEELCSLVPKEHMPYVHIGTDEVKSHERPNDTYIKDIYDVLKKNGREVIGWYRGITAPAGYHQTVQTWAETDPHKTFPHIDSRGNYINHIDHLTFLTFMTFQQPCRVPFGNEKELGGIICYWPDIYAPDENLSMLNAPVWQCIVGYPEAVWTGVKNNDARYWSTIPKPETEEGKQYRDMERRVVEHRNRFLKNIPFPYVANADIPWKILGPLEEQNLVDIGPQKIKKSYQENGKTFTWNPDTYYGGTVELRHCFSVTRMPYGGHFHKENKANDKLSKVYAYTRIWSPKDQTVGFFIGFNTMSASDTRSGAMVKGQWSRNSHCKVWVNNKEILPPEWKNPGRAGNEIPLTDEVYATRPLKEVELKKGWNTVMISAARSWKWHYTFCPAELVDGKYREVKGLKFSADFE